MRSNNLHASSKHRHLAYIDSNVLATATSGSKPHFTAREWSCIPDSKSASAAHTDTKHASVAKLGMQPDAIMFRNSPTAPDTSPPLMHPSIITFHRTQSRSAIPSNTPRATLRRPASAYILMSALPTYMSPPRPIPRAVRCTRRPSATAPSAAHDLTT
uniref:Uncharacterized protein n=1 Tax=Arundo donax TaxID=35708 RepID=A0A0A9GFV5_ARUDO